MAVSSFDSMDELFARLREEQDAADARVQPWQSAIQPGDYVVRSTAGLRVYSQILPDPDTRSAELKHYRYTRSYSTACPDGELGDIHVSTIERKLPQPEFLEAKKRGWRESGGRG